MKIGKRIKLIESNTFLKVDSRVMHGVSHYMRERISISNIDIYNIIAVSIFNKILNGFKNYSK